jgi:exodeoxyribonuclease VII large subunit
MSKLPLFSPTLPSAWSVTDLTRYLRDLFESDELLQDVWVHGEVSNFSRPASGHLYFTIKDRGASLRCVMWRNNAIRLSATPRDGDAIEVHGAISIYEVGGQYQLYADLIRQAGEGALYQQFLRLKARLEAEGLFDTQRKRPIPEWPHRIGIVTSPSGAALRDMLNTLQRRYPLIQVYLAPTSVQGEDAPPGIVAALQALNQLVQPDVILLARGGGSIEDLWAFNDERVARAVAASTAPVICGVGHETDFTIADFVADLRAPTPTAAAELATPDQLELRTAIQGFTERLERSIQSNLNTTRWAFSTLHNRLLQHSPRTRLQTGRQHLDELTHRACLGITHYQQLQKAHLAALQHRLAALSPQGVLQRGYAFLTSPTGQIIYTIQQAHPGDVLSVQVTDGSFPVRVENSTADPLSS